MNALFQIVGTAVLTVALFVGGFAVGRKSVRHALVYNPGTKTWVPLVLKQDTKIAVASPFGVEPGVDAKRQIVPNEGPVVLILPPSLIHTGDDDGVPQQQNQSDHERVDRAQVLRASN